MLNAMWPDAQRKRGREDEYADVATGGTLGFTEHRTKRLQSLPLRTSPTSRRYTELPTIAAPTQCFTPSIPPRTITPGASDSEETSAVEQQQHTWASEPELLPSQPSPWAAVPDSGYGDMDMMDASEPTPEENNWQSQDHQPNQQQHLEPGPFQPDPTAPTTTGRMPTPIHCSFAQQVRGNNWSEAAGNIPQADDQPHTMDTDAFNRHSLLSDPSTHSTTPRSLQVDDTQLMTNWSMVQNRRLPSPISESGGEDGGLDSPHMVLDSSSQHLPNAQHPLLQAATTTTPTRQQSSPPGMDVEKSAAGGGGGTPSPGGSRRFGHTRSKHTVNSWTALQPGMKRSFSIGYRADCEKCRMRVPGHFNHIIIS